MVHRVIGKFGGTEPGALVVATAALHGNEPAGVRALEAAFDLLNQTQGLEFKGTFIGLIGNLHAFANSSRFVERDFNRIWTPHHLEMVLGKGEQKLHGEDLELLHLYQVIHETIHSCNPDQILFLDLHTTSAGGGIFCIPTDENGSLHYAKALHAPVILELFNRVEGTLLRFATDGHFSDDIPVGQIHGVAYEAGQHDDPLSVSRSLSAILNTLHYAGCVNDSAIKSPDEMILQKSFSELPKVTRLVHAHHIKPGDTFKMRPGYVNFQRVKAGEHLADDIRGQVLAPYSGMILMPLYQPQGSDGFFLVLEEEKRN
ncbi:MAG: succinylglutamate desuccinylase/aspartoacylase family protein [Saprospiraceae bacterium]|nr:succinylglutamate desuccinylase/aspartoacylase family protein [Saprospiraceae bacterium]